MVTPKPKRPRRIPRGAVMLLALGMLFTAVALGIRFDARSGTALDHDLQAIADSVVPAIG